MGSEVLRQHLPLIIPIDLSGVKCLGAHVPFSKLFDSYIFLYLPLWGLTEILSSFFSPSDFVVEIPMSGLAPAILDWYGHCVCVRVHKVGGLGVCSPRKIRHSEIASEGMFGPKKLLESSHL